MNRIIYIKNIFNVRFGNSSTLIYEYEVGVILDVLHIHIKC